MNEAVPLLHDFLHHSAHRLPSKGALVCGEQRLTYADVEHRSNALAHALVRRGVARGDRVVVFAENTAEAAISFWAVLKANAVVVMVNAQTRADKLAWYLNDCRAVALISESRLSTEFLSAMTRTRHLRSVIISGPLPTPLVEGPVPLTAWDKALADESPSFPPTRRSIDLDLAAIIYTSGSTGEPKGVMLTHRNMFAAATSISSYLRMVEDDVVLNVLPLAFDYGLYQLILTARVGARLVLERSFAFPARVLLKIVQEGVTGFPGVPTVFSILSEMRGLWNQDFSRVRFVTNTAAALSPKHIQMLRELFPQSRIYSMYGLTECKRCTYLPPEDLDRKPGSVGIPIPNTEVWVVDENGQRLDSGQVGQLVVRGPTVMRGYWEKPAATAERLKPGPLPGESILYTGDLCRMDAEGYVYFVARMDDIIKSRGEKVAPKEVESTLMNIPGVKETAVIGVPDATLGQAVKAFVVLEQGAAVTEKDLHRACLRNLEPHAVPRYFQLVPNLPKTSTGKIKKTDLS
ncbi:class I adenylate-forming enzyme family protein [Hyalangium versicolor]|uniref:class I adenylate-forming enzyme family protein n=1 Tax=Hyalangium versicolor TaxID=2861190 RepID=UPI001CC9F3B0|nr:class I adenylate-forming enzyme family protein [Hyalangium versicolor]